MPDSANRVIKNQCVRVEATAPEKHIVPAEPPELSVVVPVHNEAGNVAPLIAEIVASLSGATSFEIVYVDDGSSDETPTALTSALLSTPMLRVLRHARRSGQSTALRTGVLAARGRWIATLDGDGQNDPADIPALLARAHAVAQDRGDDGVLIAGWRTERRDGWYTRWQSRVANAVRSGLLRDGTPDTGCGLKVYARAVFLALPYFDHMHRFMPALVRRAGGEVHSVPVNHRPRTLGRSHYGLLNRFWTGLVDMAGVVWLARRARVADAVELEPLVNARHRPPSTTDARSANAARHSPPHPPTVGEWSTRGGDAA